MIRFALSYGELFSYLALFCNLKDCFPELEEVARRLVGEYSVGVVNVDVLVLFEAVLKVGG